MGCHRHMLSSATVLVLMLGMAGCAAEPREGSQVASNASAGSLSTVETDAALFINLTSDDPHRVNMALKFGGDQLDRGHPLTVLLNDKGVLLGSQKNAEKYGQQHATWADPVS